MAAFSHFSPFHSGGCTFLDLLFPNICSVCGQENFHSRDPVCAGCDDQWIPMDLKNRVQELAVRKNIDRAYTGWEFGPELRALIHPLKYQDRFLSGAATWKTGQGEAEPGTGCLNPGTAAPRKIPGKGIQPGPVDLPRPVPGIAASDVAQGDNKSEIHHISDHPGPRRAAE